MNLISKNILNWLKIVIIQNNLKYISDDYSMEKNAYLLFGTYIYSSKFIFSIIMQKMNMLMEYDKIIMM